MFPSGDIVVTCTGIPKTFSVRGLFEDAAEDRKQDEADDAEDDLVDDQRDDALTDAAREQSQPGRRSCCGR